MLRRDALWNADSGKPNMQFIAHEEFSSQAASLLEDIQASLFAEAASRRDANITRGIKEWGEVEAFYQDGSKYPGWLEVQWSRPTGEALEKVVEQLKSLKLTFRNVPRDAGPADGACIFTGEPAVERILIARAY